MSFAKNLTRIQDERGETSYRLAQELGISQTSVKNWREGITVPHRAYLKILADHFGVTVDELLSDEAEKGGTPP